MESVLLPSVPLQRFVRVDYFLPSGRDPHTPPALLFINDGQDLVSMGFREILEGLYARGKIAPLICAGIHAGKDRKLEYGVAAREDYQGRGSKAAAYTDFVLKELIPDLEKRYDLPGSVKKAFAGCSLGALSALDIVWSHPEAFGLAGLFSGSFWWRDRDQQDPAYCDDTDRIMQRQVREGHYHPGQRFFFECGGEDEKADRNGNGIIDSIDDTRDLIGELVKLGYQEDKNIRYLEIPDGRHEVATWARAMPVFLEWGFGSHSGTGSPA